MGVSTEQGINIELQHANIDPNKIHEVEGGRFKTIQDLIDQSFEPEQYKDNSKAVEKEYENLVRKGLIGKWMPEIPHSKVFFII